MWLSFLVGCAWGARFRNTQSCPAELLQKAGECPSADHALDGSRHAFAQSAVRRDEPDPPANCMQLRRPSRDPVVRYFASGPHHGRPFVDPVLTDEPAGAATIEDDHRLGALTLGPHTRPLHEPVLCEVRPARPHRVARVHENDRLGDPLDLHGSSMRPW
jgi:hypothetical protein